MFGGGTQYVETLNTILEYVDANQPTSDEFVEWHRGTFENVSREGSIMRRVDYLEQVGFIEEEASQWKLGHYGHQYAPDNEKSTLLRIMCERNVGLRSLLYALSVGSMSIEEISDQQLDTHSELGWSRGETDMAAQRANWLRSLGLVRKHDDEYELTNEGRSFVEEAVEEWASSQPSPDQSEDAYSAAMYETSAYTRAIDPEFRITVLSRFDNTCPVSGVDHPGLIDIAHVLSWESYPAYRGDLSNVLPLSKMHHAAFDRELFTIDQKYRIQVNPGFETKSDLLKSTIVNRAGESISIPEESVNPKYLRQYNSALSWI